MGKAKNKKKRLGVALTVIAVILVLAVVWVVVENLTFGVTRYTLSSEKIKGEFDGFKMLI